MIELPSNFKIYRYYHFINVAIETGDNKSLFILKILARNKSIHI
jgi:hypothetical protein